MPKKTITQLKEYFKIGKRPTENQFTDLIDSYVHIDASSEYSTSVEFPANYQVGDYVEFVNFDPSKAHAGGFYEVSIAYTRGNHASAATHIAAVSHANPDIWRECGAVNKNNYLDGPGNFNFTVDVNAGACKFRIRAVNTFGMADQVLGVAIKIRSINKNEAWAAIDNRGNTTSSVSLQPMSNEWNLWVGNLHYAGSAKVALKVNTNGDVGVGTSVPEAKLHVKEADNLGNVNKVSALFDRNEAAGGSTKIRLKYHSTADLELNSGYSGTGFEYGSYSDFNIINNGLSDTYGAINFVTSKMTRINIAGNGNVAIGANASNSTQPLTVRGRQGYNEGGPTDGTNSKGLLRLQSSDKGLGEVLDFGMNIGPSYGWIQPQNSDIANVFYDLSLNPKGGNVGIGTRSPDQKLTVKGKIHAEDVIVDTNVPADYVFQKYYDNYSPIRNDYQMPNLNELESYVKENKHLPEIPSGESMMKDGITVGDFQMKLLQKIEELTLYMISQNKEIESLKKIVNNA